ncbi:MAG: 3-phenylpropionate/trans-cinnamate dioxygenase ferredoxin component [Chloroflexota bacterium]|nr:3-phenylpropionate/trans-cinnamate dioxygenase ferredoxin component [Chloroflexota bacterium]
MIRVASLDEIPDGGAHRVEIDGEEIAIVRAGAVLYAISDICSHEHFHLSDGEVDVDELSIECPKHGSAFGLEDGQPRSLPAVLPVRTYGVREEGGDVFVEVLNPTAATA